jgi:hypothetical protein
MTDKGVIFKFHEYHVEVTGLISVYWRCALSKVSLPNCKRSRRSGKRRLEVQDLRSERYAVLRSTFQRSANILVRFGVYSDDANYEIHLTGMLIVVSIQFLACFPYFITKTKAVALPSACLSRFINSLAN